MYSGATITVRNLAPPVPPAPPAPPTPAPEEGTV